MQEPTTRRPSSDRPAPEPQTPSRFLRLYQERASVRRRVRRIVVWSLFAVLVYTFFLAEGGLASIVWRRARVRQLENDIAKLQHRESWLQRELELRKGDRNAIERLARERYGMAYPGDKVYRIVQIPETKARALEQEQSRPPTDPDE